MLCICEASSSVSKREWWDESCAKIQNVARRFWEVFGGIYKWVHIFVHTVFWCCRVRDLSLRVCGACVTGYRTLVKRWWNIHIGAQSEGITAPATASHAAAQSVLRGCSGVFKMKIELTRGHLTIFPHFIFNINTISECERPEWTAWSVTPLRFLFEAGC